MEEDPLNVLSIPQSSSHSSSQSSIVPKQVICVLSVFSDIDIVDPRFIHFMLSRPERSSYLPYLSGHIGLPELLVYLLDDQSVFDRVVFSMSLKVVKSMWIHLWRKSVTTENTCAVMRLLQLGSSFLKNERCNLTERVILDLPITSNRIKYFKELYKVKHTEEMFEYVTLRTSPEWYEVLLEFI